MEQVCYFTYIGACNNALNFNGWGISDFGEDSGLHKSQESIFCVLGYCDSENMHGFYLLSSAAAIVVEDVQQNVSWKQVR